MLIFDPFLSFPLVYISSHTPSYTPSHTPSQTLVHTHLHLSDALSYLSPTRYHSFSHLLLCAFSGLGLSKERDLEERQLTQQAVILECEVGTWWMGMTKISTALNNSYSSSLLLFLPFLSHLNHKVERLRRQQHLTAGFGYWSDDDVTENKDKATDKGGTGSLTGSSKEKGSEKDKETKARTTRAGRGSGMNGAPGSDKRGKASLLPNSQFLHLLLRGQVQSVMTSLHEEIAATWVRRLEEQRAQRAAYDAVLAAIRTCIGDLPSLPSSHIYPLTSLTPKLHTTTYYLTSPRSFSRVHTQSLLLTIRFIQASYGIFPV